MTDASLAAKQWICISCGRKPLSWSELSGLQHLNHKFVHLVSESAARQKFLSDLSGAIISDMQLIAQKVQQEKAKRHLLEERMSLLRRAVVDIVETRVISPITKRYDSYIAHLELEAKEFSSRCQSLVLNLQRSISETVPGGIARWVPPTMRFTVARNSLYAPLQEMLESTADINKAISQLDRFSAQFCEFGRTCATGDQEKQQFCGTNSTRLVVTQRDGKTLGIFDPLSGKCYTRKVEGIAEFNEYYPCARAAGRLYLSTVGRGFFEVDISQEPMLVVKKADMLFNKERQAFADVNGEFVYSLGGREDDVTVGKCECFDIKKNCWRIVPALVYPVRNQGVMIADRHTLYCYGGITNENVALNVCQKLDTLDESSGWSIIPLQFEGGCEEKARLYFAGTIELSPGKCLILGGRDTVYKRSSCFSLDPERKTLRNEKTPLRETSLFFCVPVAHKGLAHLLACDNKPVCFDLKRRSFVGV